MPTRKKKSSTKNNKPKGKSFTKEEGSIASYFRNSLEVQNGVNNGEEESDMIDLKENLILAPEVVNSTKNLLAQRSDCSHVPIRRSLSVPPPRLATRKAKAPSESSDQPKISDYFVVRRSSRTSAQEIKKKEKEELEYMITSRAREMGEEHIKVVPIPGKGRGVVASRVFNRGEFVVEYAGDLIEHSIAKKRESAYRLSPLYGCYMYYFSANNKQYCVDATEETGRLGRLVNHSRLKANCCTKVVDVRGDPRLILIAVRVIEPGEELLYDYGDRKKESLIAHPWLAT